MEIDPDHADPRLHHHPQIPRPQPRNRADQRVFRDLHREPRRRGGYGDPVTDPAVVATVAARAMARHAHHEAGHAVAAGAAGGQLVDVFLGVVDWSTCDDGADTAGGTVHCTAWEHQPFVTFAGPWAEATWVVENDPEVSDFDDA